MSKRLSIEDLATMIERGFQNTATQQSLHDLEARFDDKLGAVVDSMDLMRNDIHDIKITLGGLVRSATALEEIVQLLDKRVTRLEEKTAARS